MSFIFVLQKIEEPNFVALKKILNQVLHQIAVNVNNLSISFLVISFIFIFIFFVVRKQEVNLSRISLGSIGASTIPMGLALIGCAFDNSLLIDMKNNSGIELYLALAGLSLIFLSFQATFKEIKTDKKEKK
jgi:uncharacterized membrane protein